MDGVSVDCRMLGPGTETCDNCKKIEEKFATGVEPTEGEGSFTDSARTSAVTARSRQTLRILDYLRTCRYHCPFCLFLTGAKPGHTLEKCPYRSKPRSTRSQDGSCLRCGIPTTHCINSSPDENTCQNYQAVFALVEAVFEDESIRERVYGEAGIRELELDTHAKLLNWLVEKKTVESIIITNCWILL
ncbi:hypothetical protein TWF481_002671 [Arthrobotrys musiformis]|uniref:Nanos-type domain-containing protein n=1 Tax=Arthrobotrys musiformis TaxID=47236 RepID=A0AAV9VR30_9PEZI